MIKRITNDIYLKKYENKILELYESGYNSAYKIKDYFKEHDILISHKRICKTLKDNNIITGNNSFAFSSDDEEKILKLYEEGKKIKEIASIFGLKNYQPISKVLKRKNIKIDKRRSSRVKNINENYFDNIDTEFKAYILGFLIADGCVLDSTNTLSFQLKSDDSYILELFDSEIGGTGVCNFMKRGHSFVTYGSKKLCNSLSKYGVVPRKTGIEYIPKNEIEQKFIRHLIRGFFDGDGTVFLRTDKSKKFNTRLEFGFSGNNQILNQVKDILINDIHISDNKIIPRKGVCQLNFSKFNDIVNFYHYIYDDSTICLRRKRDKFENFINLYDSAEVIPHKE